MVPYFLNDSDWDKFLSIVRSWYGTPYRHMTAVKGRGADCTLFIASCWVEAGILKKLTYDYYPKDWYVHCSTERILEGLYRHFAEQTSDDISIDRFIPDSRLMRGDVVSMSVFSKLRISNHAVLYLGDGLVAHASPKKGVVEISNGPWVQTHATNVFRIMRG